MVGKLAWRHAGDFVAFGLLNSEAFCATWNWIHGRHDFKFILQTANFFRLQQRDRGYRLLTPDAADYSQLDLYTLCSKWIESTDPARSRLQRAIWNIVQRRVLWLVII